MKVEKKVGVNCCALCEERHPTYRGATFGKKQKVLCSFCLSQFRVINDENKCTHPSGWFIKSTAIWIDSELEPHLGHKNTPHGSQMEAVCNLSNLGCKAKRFVYFKNGKFKLGKIRMQRDS